jgi:hypothetical protein
MTIASSTTTIITIIIILIIEGRISIEGITNS